MDCGMARPVEDFDYGSFLGNSGLARSCKDCPGPSLPEDVIAALKAVAWFRPDAKEALDRHVPNWRNDG